MGMAVRRQRQTTLHCYKPFTRCQKRPRHGLMRAAFGRERVWFGGALSRSTARCALDGLFGGQPSRLGLGDAAGEFRAPAQRIG